MMNASAMRTRAAVTTGDPRWASVLARDERADGEFYYSVETTGVYCRPSCRARRPRPENVRFHPTTLDAERAGFRACKRCRPGARSLAETHAAKVAEACRAIEAADEAPRLEALAAAAGLSPFYFHRLFKATVGLTPKQYAKAHRSARMRGALSESGSVTEAIYGAGYRSNGRFYEDANGALGMTPSTYRVGGRDTDIRFAIGECALGAILVAESDRGICAIALGDDPDGLARDLQDRFPHARLIGGDAEFERRVAEVVGFVEAPALGLGLPLDVRGTAFQQRVWRALRDIPPGETVTYTELAARIGAPRAVRAVAAACAANRLAVAIPCHRVVRRDGGLAGYRWGVERKMALLEQETNGDPER